MNQIRGQARPAVLAALLLALSVPRAGQAGAGTTTRVRVSSSGDQGTSSSHNPAMSGDDRYVASDSFADNLA
jgi:hypothetical protein